MEIYKTLNDLNPGYMKDIFQVQQSAYSTRQFGTQVRFRWSRDRNNRIAENAFSAPWYFSEMEFEPAAG